MLRLSVHDCAGITPVRRQQDVPLRSAFYSLSYRRAELRIVSASSDIMCKVTQMQRSPCQRGPMVCCYSYLRSTASIWRSYVS